MAVANVVIVVSRLFLLKVVVECHKNMIHFDYMRVGLVCEIQY